MSGKVYGRAYPITQKDVKAYKRVNRALKANPIGVTAMASVNGRGAYRSARSVAQGKSRKQRIQRAAEVYRNGNGVPMAGLRSGKKRSVKRNSGRDSRGRFVTVRKASASSGRLKGPKTTRTAPAARAAVRKNKVRRNKSVGYSKSYSAGYDKTFSKKKRKVSAKKASTARKYKRVKLKDPSTGKTRLSYMYKSKGGKLKRIPTKSLGLSKKKITSGRKKAAARIKKHGSAFVANKATGKKRVSAKQRRAGRRLAAYAAAKRQGKTVKAAKAIALRKVPLAKGDSFKGEAKAPVTVGAHKKRKTRVRRNKRKKTSLRRNGRKRKVALVKNAKKRLKRAKATTVRRKRRKSTTSKKTVGKTVRRRVKRRKSRKATGGTAARKTRRKKKKTTSKKRSKAKATRTRKKSRKGKKRSKSLRSKPRKRSLRRNGRKGFFSAFRRNSFGANLKAIVVSGLFVFTGYMAHRVLTNLLVNKALATTLPDNKAFQTWKKPIAGAGVFLIGQFIVGKVAPKRAIELGAGMFASLVQSVIVTALTSGETPNAELIATVSGYENSAAYSLRGTRRRRGVRGLERHATSIGPRYTPVLGQYSQAAAGWQQAAAGWEQAAAGTGEYFSASGTGEYFTATGEYFAPAGIKGVGAYEPAGQLAMQASAGANTIIRDGLRPDSNLDRALDIAEAAAGIGEAPAVEQRVPQQSQWIPNGPLWAGERAVTDTQDTSEISAGILQRPGGNGILSGG